MPSSPMTTFSIAPGRPGIPQEIFPPSNAGPAGHDPRYIVQLLRLLLYTPDAANLESFLELCHSQTLKAKIATVDAPLIQELQALRKTRSAVSGGDASANTEKAPVAVADTPAV